MLIQLHFERLVEIMRVLVINNAEEGHPEFADRIVDSIKAKECLEVETKWWW